MKPQLALVRFTTSDRARAVVKVDRISRFNPVTVNDFDSKKSYQVMCKVVRRSDSDLTDEHYDEPYPAKVLLLAATDRSMVSEAKKRNEKLPPGYADRVKKDHKDKQNSDGNEEKKKTAREEKKAMRLSHAERYRDIIDTNVQDSSLKTDTSKDESIDSSLKTDEDTAVNTDSSLKPDEDKASLTEMQTAGFVQLESHETPLVKVELSTGEGLQLDTKSEAKAAGDEIEITEDLCVEGSGKKLPTPTFKLPPALRERAKRHLFSEPNSGADSDSGTSFSSYQSSTSRLKEMETKLVSLQLDMQCMKKKNSMLSRCLSSYLDHLQEESERIQNILFLHGDMDQTTHSAQATNKNWLVSPSPNKGMSVQKGISPSKICHSPSGPKKQATPLKEVKGKSPVSVKKQSTTPKNSFSEDSYTPVKQGSGLNTSPKSCKVSPNKKAKVVKKTEKKHEYSLKPGERTAEAIADDLLKVLKKEREIQMNESRTKVCIGNNAWVKKGIWKDKFSKSTSNLKKLVNELTEEVWGYPACAQYSLTGGKGPKNTNVEASLKPPAPPGQVEAIYGLCRAQLMWQGMKHPDHLKEAMRQCKLHLRAKLNESARKLKRETKE